MAKCGYTIPTGGPVALVAATAKTVLGVQVAAGASYGMELKKLWFGFDGVSASAVPVTVELCVCTFATNPPGTASTSVTPQQVYGRTITHGLLAAKGWTAEPTVITPFADFPLSPAGGLVLYDVPLGDCPDFAPGAGLALRLTAAAGVNVRATAMVERI